MNMKTRFAPSPTGPFHIGSLRTALLVQALAKSKEGEAMLRIEDTDLQRSTTDYEKEIYRSLDWAGIPFSGDIPRQSNRLDLYKEVIDEMIDKGLAYYCYMSLKELDELRADIDQHNRDNPDDYREKKYDNRYRPENFPNGVPDEIKKANPNPVVRIKMPNDGETTWKDGGKGEITIQNTKLDDLIIRRADGSPTYNFVVVVDDMDMGVTDVIRGEDHINNTPKQIQIHKILKQLPRFANAPKINYAHLPLMLNPDGSKISKSALSKDGDNSKVPAQISTYREIGIVPQALVNYLLLISSQKTAQKCGGEIFSFDDFVKKFKSSDLSNSSARFDMNKLYNINFKYINKLSDDEFKQMVVNFDNTVRMNEIGYDYIAADLKKRSKTLVDAVNLINELADIKQNINEIYQNMTPFAKAGFDANTEDEFKDVLNQEAQKTGATMADVSKKFREESKLNTVLPFFPTICAVKHLPANKLKFK